MANFINFIIRVGKKNRVSKLFCHGITFGFILALLVSVVFAPIKAEVTDISYSLCGLVMEKIKGENKDEIKTDTNEKTEQDTNDSTKEVKDEFLANLSPKMTFIIENKGEAYYTEKMEYKAYFKDIENLSEYLNSLYSSKTPVISQYVYSSCQTMEDDFIARLEHGEDIKSRKGQCIEWYEALPKENELCKVITMQESYADSKPCYLVFHRLSNNYQKLALEYHYQNANEDKIKYLYLQSILYDLDAISYAQNPMEFYGSIDRIRTRYEDILFCCTVSKEEMASLNLLREKMYELELTK